jgi:glyoxylate carboligase
MVVNFPDRRVDALMAELRREGVAFSDLVSAAEVEPFWQAVRRHARRLGVRVRSGCGSAVHEDEEGKRIWTHGQRVWA